MPKKSTKPKKDAESAVTEADLPKFEETLAELETIVSDLEDGKLGLSEALGKYEKGVACLKQCYQLLQTAEQKIEMLSSVSEAGEVRVVPFTDAAGKDS